MLGAMMSKGFWISRTLIDIVRPEPKTERDLWLRWQNDIHSKFISMVAHRPGNAGKVIEVVEK